MKFLRILLLPLSYIYGTIVWLRNKLFDFGVLSSIEFDTPIISIGNLSVGGTGKTPHIEYLIKLLKSQFYIATLSRGYGRKTSGFLLSDINSTSAHIGDEPTQIKKKFPRLKVAVDENRVRGIKKLKELFPSLQTILLDDAFQHRAVKPGISILLSDFNHLYTKDYIMPSGRLREFARGAKRADIIVVTKCPEILLPIERKRIVDELQPLPYQHVYFSFIKYGDFIPMYLKSNLFTKDFYFERNYTILLLTGIANSGALTYYLGRKVKNIIHQKFSDHHQFNINDIEKLKNKFDSIATENKIILTTEKDAMRLRDEKFSTYLENLPIFYIPIEIDFHNKDKELFNEQILHYVRANQKYSNIHSK